MFIRQYSDLNARLLRPRPQTRGRGRGRCQFSGSKLRQKTNTVSDCEHKRRHFCRTIQCKTWRLVRQHISQSPITHFTHTILRGQVANNEERDARPRPRTWGQSRGRGQGQFFEVGQPFGNFGLRAISLRLFINCPLFTVVTDVFSFTRLARVNHVNTSCLHLILIVDWNKAFDLFERIVCCILYMNKPQTFVHALASLNVERVLLRLRSWKSTTTRLRKGFATQVAANVRKSESFLLIIVHLFLWCSKKGNGHEQRRNFCSVSNHRHACMQNEFDLFSWEYFMKWLKRLSVLFSCVFLALSVSCCAFINRSFWIYCLGSYTRRHTRKQLCQMKR